MNKIEEKCFDMWKKGYINFSILKQLVGLKLIKEVFFKSKNIEDKIYI
ncbi:MAG: hypothetical protein ACOCUI_01865 [bacterium]